MTQFGFDAQAFALRRKAANDQDTYVSSASERAAGPSIVTLESGIQALVEIVGFTYVEGVPVAICGPLAEDIDASELLERGPDGVCFKRV